MRHVSAVRIEKVWASGPFDDAGGKWWWRRKSIRQHRVSLHDLSEVRRGFDSKENERIRLDDDASVGLAGLSLAEVFTPSSVSGLYDAIDRLPVDSREYKKYIRDELAGTRSATSFGGWRQLALVRPPGRFILSDGFHDDRLPAGVDAVWITLFTPLPSVIVLIATFVIEEDAGSLNKALRNDYESTIHSVRVSVRGRLGGLRRHLPWARPRDVSYSHGIWPPHAMQRKACEDQLSVIEDEASRWLSRVFPGRFANVESNRRPIMRIFLTQGFVPFSGRSFAMQSLRLDSGFNDVWRSEKGHGWAVSSGECISRCH